MTQNLAPLVLAKLREQVERLDHLLMRIPPGALTLAARSLERLGALDTKAAAHECRRFRVDLAPRAGRIWALGGDGAALVRD